MNARAPYAQENAQVPRRPSRTFRVAVDAVFVVVVLQHLVQQRLTSVLYLLLFVFLGFRRHLCRFHRPAGDRSRRATLPKRELRNVGKL